MKLDPTRIADLKHLESEMRNANPSRKYKLERMMGNIKNQMGNKRITELRQMLAQATRDKNPDKMRAIEKEILKLTNGQ